jgi:5-hydroxyisourate hydrolase-like protein (transthyretin family)
MFIRASLAAVLVLFSFPAMAGKFQGNVAGVVLDERSGAKLSGVAITLQVKDILKSNLPATQPDGRFDLDLRQIFPDEDLENRTIELTFRKADYHDSVFLLNSESDMENWDQLEIQLIKPREIEKLPKEQREKIEKYVSQKGKTLYLFPYHLTEETISLKPPGLVSCKFFYRAW